MKRDHIIIHCSATKPSQNITATDIDKWHRAKGWWGNGYHYVITRDGRIQSAENGDRCRPLDRAGAHVGDCGLGWNSRSLGVCLVGGVDENNKPEDNFTEAQWKALEELVLTLLDRFPSINTIGGHRDLIRLTGAPPKACPSFDVADWWKNKVLPKYQDSRASSEYIERFRDVKVL